MNTRQSNTTSDKENQLTLELLKAIDQKDDISQRHLAQQMGVALGLANSYLKRCVKKGWIKISTAPANRYMYYLTPTGFAEKARLTAEFFSTSLALFRQSGDEYTSIFEHCAQQQYSRIVLAGLSDLTEIALMRGLQSRANLIAVYQPEAGRTDFFDVPVVSVLPTIDQYDCVVLTSMEQTNELLSELEVTVSQDRLFVPEMLLTMKYRQAAEAEISE
jgi:DNA-binding MarR family transcriptional regulator